MNLAAASLLLAALATGDDHSAPPSTLEGRPAAADSEIVRVAVGPSNQGTFKEPAQRRRVGAGDVVIIPPGVYHGFDEITTGIEYLAVRPDPDHVLPAGFVHPAVKK